MSIGSSSLDVNTLVAQLVANERSSYATRLTARETKATIQLSAISSLKGALSTFKTSVDGLKSANLLAPRATTTSDEKVLTVTAQGNAATGSYDITVVALAKAQQLATKAYAGGSTTEIGTGTLTISFGTTSFDVEIGDDQKTLAGIRDAINKSGDNTGVQATLLNEQNGTRLLLTSAKTGAANEITISQSGGNGGLSVLAYSGTDTADIVESRPAQDAHIKIGTYDHFASTNTVTSAIDDVTIKLVAESATPVSIGITEDTAALKKRVSDFVAAYNTLQSGMAKMRAYDPTTRAAGPMLGDALLRGIENQIGLDLTNPVAGLKGNYTTLSSLGISRQTDGSLKLDETKLTKAIEADPRSIEKVFSTDTGIAGRLSKSLEAMLKDDAVIDSRTETLQKELKTIEKDTEALDARMKVIEARYRKQFTALDAMLTQLQSTSSYLAQQLANLPGGRSD